MKTSGLTVLLSALVCALSTQALAEETVWTRTAPIGDVCVEGDPCAKELVTLASATVSPSEQGGLVKVSLSTGSEHEVKMLNMSSAGSMVFEPPVLKVSVGDTIHFKSVDLEPQFCIDCWDDTGRGEFMVRRNESGHQCDTR